MTTAEKVLSVVLAVLFLLLLVIYGAGAVGDNSVHLPIVVNGQARCTPTLAPTMCPGWYEDGVCSPTPTPYTICIPGPCDGS